MVASDLRRLARRLVENNNQQHWRGLTVQNTVSPFVVLRSDGSQNPASLTGPLRIELGTSDVS